MNFVTFYKLIDTTEAMHNGDLPTIFFIKEALCIHIKCNAPRSSAQKSHTNQSDSRLHISTKVSP